MSMIGNLLRVTKSELDDYLKTVHYWKTESMKIKRKKKI